MTKEKMKFTKQDIYVRNSVVVKIGFGMAICVIWQLVLVILDLDLKNRLMATNVALCVGGLGWIELCAKRIEIHGDTVACRNYLWRKKQFSIYEIGRIGTEKKKASNYIMYGKEGEKLVRFKGIMEEISLALFYLESRGIDIGADAQDDITYEEFYEQICKAVIVMRNKLSMKIIGSLNTGMGIARITYLIKQNAGNMEAAGNVADSVLPSWDVGKNKRKATAYADIWKLNKKYDISVEREADKVLRVVKLRELCSKQGIAVKEILPTKEGSSFVLKDEWICEVMKRQNAYQCLEGFTKKKRKCKALCFKAGAELAKFQGVLEERPEFIRDEETCSTKESRIKSAMELPDQLLTKEQWEQIVSEADRVSKRANKQWTVITNQYSIEANKKRIQLSDYYLGNAAEQEVVTWQVCNYMAELASNVYMVCNRLSPRKWYAYVEQMLAGYESVREFTKQERDSIRPFLCLAVALQMAEHNEFKKDRKKLRKIYRFLQK